MRNKFALALLALGALLERVPNLALVPFALAADGDEKKLTFGEQLSAWLRDKATMAADLAAAQKQAATLATENAQLKQDVATAKASAEQASADLASAQTAHTTALDEAKAATKTAQDQLATANAALAAFCAAVGLKHADLAAMTPADAEKALQEAHAKHVSSGVAQRLGELGVPENKLPKSSSQTPAESLEEVQSALAAETDPLKRGQLALRANQLRDALWAAQSGQKSANN